MHTGAAAVPGDRIEPRSRWRPSWPARAVHFVASRARARPGVVIRRRDRRASVISRWHPTLTTDKDIPMNWSFQLYSARNFQPWDQVLKLLAEAGYRQVEGFGGVYADAAALRAELDRNGLTMPSGHVS